MTRNGRPIGAWRKSSKSHPSECVEVLLVPDRGVALIRDSTDPSGPRLEVPLGSWASFLRGACGSAFEKRID